MHCFSKIARKIFFRKFYGKFIASYLCLKKNSFGIAAEDMPVVVSGYESGYENFYHPFVKRV
jgi:hypothetical protein